MQKKPHQPASLRALVTCDCGCALWRASDCFFDMVLVLALASVLRLVLL